MLISENVHRTRFWKNDDLILSVMYICIMYTCNNMCDIVILFCSIK